MEKIVLKWDVQSIEDVARVTAMYCFKNCNNTYNYYIISYKAKIKIPRLIIWYSRK